jgi:prepilin-type N-terminal cleavage/methylation domain-containing protein
MKKAFTLIELLVVIAIIAILAAILFPVFASAKEAAKAAVNLSNIKQISLAVLEYSADNDDSFPLAIREESQAGQTIAYPNAEGASLVTTPAGIIPWHEAIYPYTKNRDIYTSPLATAPTGLGPVKHFIQSGYFGVVPRASALAYQDANGRFLLRTAITNQGAGAYIDGPFGAGVADDAALITVYTVPSLTQTSIEHISDMIMIADAGAFDMGFMTTTTAPTGSSTTPACTSAVLPNPYTGYNAATVYSGPWARRQVSGSYGGGKSCEYEAGQRGAVTYAACDGSAKRADLTKIYEVKYASTLPVYNRMYVGSTD